MQDSVVLCRLQAVEASGASMSQPAKKWTSVATCSAETTAQLCFSQREVTVIPNSAAVRLMSATVLFHHGQMPPSD